MSSDTIKVDTPLTRLRAEYEARLADRDREIAELRQTVAALREERGKVSAMADLLRLQLADVLAHIRAHKAQMDLVEHNVSGLQDKLVED